MTHIPIHCSARSHVFGRLSHLAIALLSALWFGAPLPAFERPVVSLRGQWSCALDPEGVGEAERWYDSLPDDAASPAILPGTLDANGIGYPDTERSHAHLGKPLQFVGSAWYSKTFDVPASFAGQRVELLLERSKVTKVWINGDYVGSSRWVYSPQVLEVGRFLQPGKTNRIAICVDNTLSLVPVEGSHAYSSDTQTNWNGIIGKIRLTSMNPAHVVSVRDYPDVESRTLTFQARLTKEAGQANAFLRARAKLDTRDGKWTEFARVKVDHSKDLQRIVLELGDQAKLWSDTDPNLYEVEIELGTEDNTGAWTSLDGCNLVTGLREFKATSDGFTINGHRVFLRGKHDACVFPLTGYPPMNVGGWMREFGIAKQYGINHYRFHTFTPPAAAFEAADRLGVYIQSELPIWWGFKDDDPKQIDYLVGQGKEIVEAYANHPSFVMLSLGNELSQERAVLKAMEAEIRVRDSRPLYAQGSNNRLWDPSYAEGDDYWRSFRSGPYTEDGRYDGRMSMSYLDSHGEGGLLNSRYPSTTVNFDTALERSPVPFLGFEVGQYQVFPNFSELTKYDGVLKPYNLEIYKQRLKDAGMLDQAQDFFLASGALSVLCYRADIEAMLRTRRFAGFDVLDLQDYPGQGTALVGVLDAFMDSKGLIRPDQWRQFCDQTVLLLEQEKFCWTDAETYRAEVDLSNFSEHAYTGASIAWRLRDGRHVLKQGKIAIDSPAYSGLIKADSTISFSLQGMPAPIRLDLDLVLEDGTVKNSYPIWVYPADKRVELPDEVLVADSLSSDALGALNRGGSVLVFPRAEAIKDHSTPNQFISEFWNYEMFTGFAQKSNGPVSAGTLGLLLDPYDKVVEKFPTEFHTDYQWWPIVTYSRSLILDGLPHSYRPKIQVIDCISRMRKLGLVCEFKVGSGKLLVCTSRLPDHLEYPEVRQFYRSLLSYAASEDFRPDFEITPEKLKAMGL